MFPLRKAPDCDPSTTIDMLDSLDHRCTSCGLRLTDEARNCPRCGATMRAVSSPSLRPLILPGGVGLSDEILAATRRDRRIIAAAVTVGVVTCAVFISTRAEPAVVRARYVAQTAAEARIADQEASDAAPTAVRSDADRQGAPARSDARLDLGVVEPAAKRGTESLTARPSAATRSPDSAAAHASSARAPDSAAAHSATARAPAADVALLALARASSRAADSAPAHAARSRLQVASVDTAIAEASDAVAVLPHATPRQSGASALAAPDFRAVRSIVAPLPIAPPVAAEKLDSSEVRSTVARFVASLRARSATSADLLAFFGDGAEHRVEYVLLAGTESTTPSAKVTFDLKLSRYDAVGRFLVRILPVSMIVTKRDGVIRSSAVTYGTLRKP